MKLGKFNGFGVCAAVVAMVAGLSGCAGPGVAGNAPEAAPAPVPVATGANVIQSVPGSYAEEKAQDEREREAWLDTPL